MKRYKPVQAQPITSDPRYTLRGGGFNVQQVPPSAAAPKKRLSHSVKATPSSLSGTVVPMHQRRPAIRLFLGLGGGVRFRK